MKKSNELTFEAKLDQLETLVKRMEDGGMQLDELMKVYEHGTTLSQALHQELEKAQTRMQQLKAGALMPVEGAEHEL